MHLVNRLWELRLKKTEIKEITQQNLKLDIDI